MRFAQEASNSFTGPDGDLGAMRKRHDIVLQLAQRVRRLLGHSEIRAQELRWPPHAEASEVEDGVTGD